MRDGKFSLSLGLYEMFGAIVLTPFRLIAEKKMNGKKKKRY